MSIQMQATHVTFIRREPNDYANVVGIVRPSELIDVIASYPGMIYHSNGTRVEAQGIWYETTKGYVRSCNTTGAVKFFTQTAAPKVDHPVHHDDPTIQPPVDPAPVVLEPEYKPVDPNKLQPNDVVRIRHGACDAHGYPLSPYILEPAEHSVYSIDSSRTFALLGYPTGIRKWVYIDTLLFVRHGEAPRYVDGSHNHFHHWGN